MGYRKDSLWDDTSELHCLLAFKKLEAEGFPRGRQIEYCRQLVKTTGLSSGSLSAKICNYKSAAGVNNDSNASIKTKEIFDKYGCLSIQELSDKIDSL